MSTTRIARKACLLPNSENGTSRDHGPPKLRVEPGPMIRRLLLVAITIATAIQPVLAAQSYVHATRDEPALYPVGGIVRLRCDGGNELRFGSIYGSARDVKRSLDTMAPPPIATLHIRTRSRLRVIATRRFQTYTPESHTKYLNYQILKVEPLTGRRWTGFVQSLDVDPDLPSRPADYFCGTL